MTYTSHGHWPDSTEENGQATFKNLAQSALPPNIDIKQIKQTGDTQKNQITEITRQISETLQDPQRGRALIQEYPFQWPENLPVTANLMKKYSGSICSSMSHLLQTYLRQGGIKSKLATVGNSIHHTTLVEIEKTNEGTIYQVVDVNTGGQKPDENFPHPYYNWNPVPDFSQPFLLPNGSSSFYLQFDTPKTKPHDEFIAGKTALHPISYESSQLFFQSTSAFLQASQATDKNLQKLKYTAAMNKINRALNTMAQNPSHPIAIQAKINQINLLQKLGLDFEDEVKLLCLRMNRQKLIHSVSSNTTEQLFKQLKKEWKDGGINPHQELEYVRPLYV